jgi:hypothetical protein
MGTSAGSAGQTSRHVRAGHGAVQECGLELPGGSPELRLELTCDDAPIVYCAEPAPRNVRAYRPVGSRTEEETHQTHEPRSGGEVVSCTAPGT